VFVAGTGANAVKSKRGVALDGDFNTVPGGDLQWETTVVG
jgi:hypothetical protein